MAFSPCLHRNHAPFRQIRPALMLARRSQRGPRSSPASSPLMTPNLEALGYSSFPSCGAATTEQPTNTYGAPRNNHSASSSLTMTSSTEPLEWQFHFIIRLAHDRAQTRQAGARHDCQFKQFIRLCSPSCRSKLVLPRFVNKTFFCLSATRAAKVRTSSPQSSRIMHVC